MSVVDAARRKAAETLARLRGSAPSGEAPAAAPAPPAPPPPLTLRPFEPLTPASTGVRCVVCTWEGEAFTPPMHCERAICPSCGAIGRDRWLFHCLVSRVPVTRETRLLETSPRLGGEYRDAMKQRLEYLSSDYDLRAHKADIALDLQDMALPDASLDVIMTSHVLEHVPDTDAALREVFRVLKPGGSVILLVPVPQGETAPPTEPEFHGDMTPVFWRFGLDLTDRLRSHGFETDLLCTEEFRRHVLANDPEWPELFPEWDVPSILAAAKPDDLTVVMDDDLARTAGLTPGYMYLAWHGRKPA
ncbi:MAG TPA: methyltransferase domain-containing protein [Mycobacteriales bacterium]|jgi:SAM-dependent methyltransferase|nr:methyltransferase domain-containing protein [Mycobacteriales bacterium]